MIFKTYPPLVQVSRDSQVTYVVVPPLENELLINSRSTPLSNSSTNSVGSDSAGFAVSEISPLLFAYEHCDVAAEAASPMRTI